MARLNETLVAEREAFARRYFASFPLHGVREMNDALTLAHTGGKMGLKRAYELEVEVKGKPGTERDEKVKALIAAGGSTVASVPPAKVEPVINTSEIEAKFKAESEAKAAAEAELAKVRESVTALTSQNAALSAEVTELRAKLAEATKPAEPKVKGPSLKDRILEALATGPSNTQGLAAFLQATPATVRGRTAELVKEGKIAKGEDGNFSLVKAEAPAATPTVEAVSETPATAPVAEPAPQATEPAPVESVPSPAVNG